MNQIMMGFRFRMERLTWMRGVLSYINRNIIDRFIFISVSLFYLF